MYLYIYIYIYTYMHIYTHTYIYIYRHMHVFTSKYMCAICLEKVILAPGLKCLRLQWLEWFCLVSLRSSTETQSQNLDGQPACSQGA